ncbi:MLP-like protein [Mya arenaria]|uniref:MLP-like protein n=1 Tax=Mya arenaria TaxID=6604 RepID=A0ABY7FNQ3_MYAAR|nr:MLP-like protein [Mya arenaria]
MDLTNANKYGSTAVFTCDDSYYLNGKSFLICQANKTWNGTTPECEAKVYLFDYGAAAGDETLANENDVCSNGLQCCYEDGLIVEDMPKAGGLIIAHSNNSPRNNAMFDVNPKEWCCENSNFCDKYYELHPIGDCYPSSWYDLDITIFANKADITKKYKTSKNGNGKKEFSYTATGIVIQKSGDAMVVLFPHSERRTPELKGCTEILFVTVDEPATCSITVSDDPAVEVDFKDTFGVANTSLQKTGVIREVVITVKDDSNPSDIRLTAVNTATNKSKELTVKILLCNCSVHGRCSREERPDPRSTNMFKFAKCDCDAQHEGPTCEFVKDGCKSEPCLDGQQCFSLNVYNQTALNTSYLCGPCPNGLREDGDKCQDVDECNETFPCEQMCTNTQGSYTCSCNSGFRIVSSNTTRCKDVDECEMNNNPPCKSKCNNKVGSFVCSCEDGYFLEKDGISCTACDRFTFGIDCGSTCGNCNTDNSLSCNNGWKGENCTTDVDECKDQSSLCTDKLNATCINTNGSYSCQCIPGFYEVDGICEACADNSYGVNCTETLTSTPLPVPYSSNTK